MAEETVKEVEAMGNVTVMKELNILVLGETGVGKSTWINALYNYFTFESFEDARVSELKYLIPCQFSVTNSKYEEQVIVVGTADDKNENLQTGQSATQQPTPYVFEALGHKIRLIDTPGIGDVRGLEQDLKNMSEILRYLATIPHINGICVLLKPNDSRVTAAFNFCVKELLKQLHRNAASNSNIVFCFTNCRGTFYRPGNTLSTLKTLLKTLPDVTIPTEKDTLYCFDNESFRFLCALKNGVEFEDRAIRDFADSWAHTAAETKRLLEYVEKLPEHKTIDSVSLNEVRSTLIMLTRPIADIGQHISLHKAVLLDHLEEVKHVTESETDLRQKLVIRVPTLVPVQLPYPKTVCTSPSCVSYHTLPGSSVRIVEYRTICHNRCGIQNVAPETYPIQELRGCSAMNAAFCTVCGCSFEKHMHFCFEQQLSMVESEDDTVKRLLGDKRTRKEAIDLTIQTINSKLTQLDQEQEKVIEIAGKFGSFLKAHAIAPYNDAMADYLHILIRQERDKVGAGCNRTQLDCLENLLKQYESEVLIMKQAMEQKSNVQLDVQSIHQLIRELYALPMTGETIRKMMVMYRSAQTESSCRKDVRCDCRRPKTTQQIRPVTMVGYSYTSASRPAQGNLPKLLVNTFRSGVQSTLNGIKNRLSRPY